MFADKVCVTFGASVHKVLDEVEVRTLYRPVKFVTPNWEYQFIMEPASGTEARHVGTGKG